MSLFIFIFSRFIVIYSTFLSYQFLLFFFQILHSSPSKKFHPQNLGVILGSKNKLEYFFHISDSLFHVSSLICELHHITLKMRIFLLRSSFSPHSSTFIIFTSSIKSSFTYTGTCGSIYIGSILDFHTKKTWNTL